LILAADQRNSSSSASTESTRTGMERRTSVC
jgi:hypothetical protein